MNLETLIEAANLIERQQAHAIDTYYPSTSGEDVGIGPAVGSPTEKQLLQYMPDGDQDLQILGRRAGAGIREVHNKLEKNRRAHLKECFDLVKNLLPARQDDKKASNLNILHNAIKYIHVLRRKEREYEHEMERLAKEKIALQQRSANLKKELSAQWDHIDFNALIPDNAASVGEGGVIVTSDSDDLIQQTSLTYSKTSSFSSAATASASPRLPSDYIPSDGPKLISFTSRLESTKRTVINSHVSGKVSTASHPQLPVPGHITAALVSPAIQLVTSQNLRVLPNGQQFTLSLPHSTGGATLMHKSIESDSLSLVHGNGIRKQGQPISLSIQNGTLGLTAKNGVIYKSSPQSPSGGFLPSITHVVTPLTGSHGTLVTPVPVTVMSQGNQVAHGKMVTTLSMKPLMSQYLVKPGAAVVVVNQSLQAK